MKTSSMNRRASLLSSFAIMAGLAALPMQVAATGDRASFQLQRTQYGVVHVRADDYAGLGAGTGRAYAQDNLCFLMELALTARGERARHFGADALTPGIPRLTNLEQDIFVRSYLDRQALATAYAQVDPDVRALIRGYVAGVNDYLRQTAVSAQDPACAGKQWVRPLTVEDVHLMTARVAHYQMMSRFAKLAVAAQPPKARTAEGDGRIVDGLSGTFAMTTDASAPDMLPALSAESITGSNGYAFGKRMTRDGGGLVLANPHLTWAGASRFYQLHWTIPGRVDAMGVSLAGLPLIVIGFNKDVAWMNPTTVAARFTLHELSLSPGDPTVYLVDGQPRRLEPREVTVDVLKADGEVQQVRHTVWYSHFGPVWVNPTLGANWTDTRAYALRDANAGNVRLFEHWLRLGTARGIDDFERAHREVNGMAWSSTVAADRTGEVLFAESSATPNLDADRIRACSTSPLAEAARKLGMLLLDGARAACDWEVVPGTRQPGLMPPERLPFVRGHDYVQNSNESAWMSVPKAPVPAASPVLGAWNKPLRLRSRLGILQVDEQVAAAGGQAALDAEQLKRMMFSNRNHAADLVMPDLLRLCAMRDTLGADATVACDVLSRWDRRDDPDSRGASLFREFWRLASTAPPSTLWTVPFDPLDPAGTPRGLNIEAASGRPAIVSALEQAVRLHRQFGFAPDVRLGDLQYVTDAQGRRIGLHGGEEFEGVYNKMGMGPLAAGGYGEAAPAGNAGATYFQIVHWDASGPVADAMLVYGQSTDPRSPYHLDQARELYAPKLWHRLPFSRRDIRRQALGKPLRLTLPLE